MQHTDRWPDRSPWHVEAEPGADDSDNPWLRTAGIFADDPTLMPMLAEIYASREAEREIEDAANERPIAESRG